MLFLLLLYVFIQLWSFNLPDIDKYIITNLVWGCLKRRLPNKLVRSCRNCGICYSPKRLQHRVTFLVHHQTSSIGIHWAIWLCDENVIFDCFVKIQNLLDINFMCYRSGCFNLPCHGRIWENELFHRQHTILFWKKNTPSKM